MVHEMGQAMTEIKDEGRLGKLKRVSSKPRRGMTARTTIFDRLLGEAQELFRSIFEDTSDAFMILRLSDLRILDVNDAFERLTGVARTTTVDLEDGLFGLPVSRERVAALQTKLNANGQLHDEPITITRREGDVRLARLSAHIIEVAGETCVLCSARDVTTLVESEAKRARAVDELLSAEETIRASLALDLHDDTLQVLAAVRIELQRIEKTVASAGLTGTARAIERARGMLDDCADRTRGLMFQLRPRVLADAGLGPALVELARELEQDGAPAIVVDAPDARYGARVEELVWRTVREALVNARRHASAKHVTVTIEEAGGALEGEIRDDGVGFDINRLAQPNHVGVDS